MPPTWSRLKTVFHAALDLPIASRGAFLDGACAGDEELRQEVESLLAHDTADDGILDPPPSTEGPRDGRIGPYRTIAELGRGGMGTVYLAMRSDETYQKRVAIKLVKRGMDTDDILTRFRQERRMLALLDHPHIARIIDGGTTDEGRPYFVMDFVDGVPLDAYCRQHRLAVAERLALFRSICDAVHYAHQNLIVHRDLKPENILVTADGTPKLLDFGIAKVLTSTAPDEGPAPTRLHDRRMTLSHASPEQVLGHAVGTSSDVYSLGVLLYTLLCGRQPYARVDPTNGSSDYLAQQIVEVDPILPSAALETRGPGADNGAPADSAEVIAAARRTTAAGLRRTLEGDLDRIVLMAMRKDPQRRYASVAQLSEDLGAYLAGLPVIAQRDTLRYRANKFVRRHKAAVALSVIALMVVVTGVAGIVWQGRLAARARDEARLETAKAERIRAFLEDTLASASPNRLGREMTVGQVLDEAATRIARELDGDPDVRASLESTIGRSYLELGAYPSSIAHLREALRLQESMASGRETMPVATALSMLGAAIQRQGDVAEAERLQRRAVELTRRIPQADDRMRADVLTTLGTTLHAKGDLTEAATLHEEALAIRRRLGQRDDGVITNLNELAVGAGTRGDWPRAEAYLREAVDLARAVHGDSHAMVAGVNTSLAYAVEAQGRQAEAVALYEDALAGRIKALGADHPETAWTMYNFASLLRKVGQQARAQTLVDGILALRGKTLLDTHPMVPSTLQLRGLLLEDAGRYADAESPLRESLALRTQTLSQSHWLVGSSESELADCLITLRRYAEAERLLLHGRDVIVAGVGAAHPRARETQARLDRLYTAWKKTPLAAR